MEPAEDILEALAKTPKASLDYADINALFAQLEKAYQCITFERNELAVAYVRQCMNALQSTADAIEIAEFKAKLSSPSPGM